MMYEIPEREALIEGIAYAAQVLSHQPGWLGPADRVLYPSGIKHCLPLRDRSTGTGRDDWTICLREDGKLALVYHHRKVENSTLVKVTKPFRQGAWGISLGRLWEKFPIALLARISYHLRSATGDPYAGYGYPVWAFTPPQGRL